MKYKWSMFCIKQETEKGIIIRNTLSGSVVYILKEDLVDIESWLNGCDTLEPHNLEDLCGDNLILVPKDKDEIATYNKRY